MILAVLILLAADQASCAGLDPSLRAAEQALHDGKADTAEELLQPMERTAAQCPRVLLLQGRIKQAQGMPSLARDLFNRYSQAAPRDPAGFTALAQSMWKQRDAATALETIARSLALDPQHAEALALRGEIYEAQGQVAASEADFKTVAAMASAGADAKFKAGAFLDRHHRPVEAVAAFQAVTRIDPDNAFAWDYLAINLEAVGQTTRAEEAFQSGLKANARSGKVDVFLPYNYGRFLMKADRLTESKSYLDQAVAAAPGTRAVYYERAKLNLLLQSISQAQADVERAISLPDPGRYVQDVQVYALAAAIAGRAGDAKAAQNYAALAKSSRLVSVTEGRK